MGSLFGITGLREFLLNFLYNPSVFHYNRIWSFHLETGRKGTTTNPEAYPE